MRLRSVTGEQKISLGQFRVLVTPEPLSFRVQRENGQEVQNLRVDAKTGDISLSLGTGPILGLGQGGEQFDLRRNRHSMAASHSGDRIVRGGRLPYLATKLSHEDVLSLIGKGGMGKCIVLATCVKSLRGAT